MDYGNFIDTQIEIARLRIHVLQYRKELYSYLIGLGSTIVQAERVANGTYFSANGQYRATTGNNALSEHEVDHINWCYDQIDLNEKAIRTLEQSGKHTIA